MHLIILPNQLAKTIFLRQIYVFVDILCILIILLVFALFACIGLPASLQITLNQLKSAFGFSLVISLLYNYDCFFRRVLSFP